MERNMDLARQILMELEKEPYRGTPVSITVEDTSNEEMVYHVMLLAEAGLIEAFELGFGEVNWMPIRLTWAGHEFLEAARDDKRWKKATKTMQTKGGGIVFEVLRELLVSMVQSKVLPTRKQISSKPSAMPR